jgi:hypothetical protein
MMFLEVLALNNISTEIANLCSACTNTEVGKKAKEKWS